MYDKTHPYLIKIKQPELNKVNSETFSSELFDVVSRHYLPKYSNNQEYYSWARFEHQPLLDDRFSHEQIWFVMTRLRKALSIETPIQSEEGPHFSLFLMKKAAKIFHELDLLAGGRAFINGVITNKKMSQSLIRSSLMEEAIASSLLEGAHTTRKAAKKFILEKRKPRSKAEIMIVNNYQTMKAIESDYRYQPLDLDLLFNIHAMLAKNDPDIPTDEQYRLRKNEDNIVVGGQQGAIAHVPPSEEFLQDQLSSLFSYANNDLQNEDDGQEYIHPLIKAIIIHFWIAYLHPFTDGNGRLARSLFYWYLIRNGYETIAYIPISTVILKSPGQYSQAFLNTEQDNYDLTYFYDYNLSKVMQSIDDFDRYVEKQRERKDSFDKVFDQHGILQDRWRVTFNYLLSGQESQYVTIEMLVNMTGVQRLAASQDLSKMTEQGWLKKEKVGRHNYYYPTSKLLSLKTS